MPGEDGSQRQATQAQPQGDAPPADPNAQNSGWGAAAGAPPVPPGAPSTAPPVDTTPASVVNGVQFNIAGQRISGFNPYPSQLRGPNPLAGASTAAGAGKKKNKKNKNKGKMQDMFAPLSGGGVSAAATATPASQIPTPPSAGSSGSATSYSAVAGRGAQGAGGEPPKKPGPAGGVGADNWPPSLKYVSMS